MRNFFKNNFRAWLAVSEKTIYGYALLLGVVTGLIALVFYKAVHGMQEVIFEEHGIMANHWPLVRGTIFTKYSLIILLSPAIGGLLTGLMILWFGKEVSGGGTEIFLESFHNQAAKLKKTIPLGKFLASLSTIGFGSSCGKEAPMSLIGAGIGSLLEHKIKMGVRARRTLFLCGAAGALGAMFRAPLGGAITAVEILYHEDFETDALIPCILSSVTAYTIFCSFAGFAHLLQFPGVSFHSVSEFLIYVLVGFLCAKAAGVFIACFYAVKKYLFAPIKLPLFLKPILGGLAVGTLGLMVPSVLGEGLGVLRELTLQPVNAIGTTALLLLLVIFFKMLATSFTIQSGGSGGVLMPCLFIGGCLGAICGLFLQKIFPDMQLPAFIIVGMTGFFAAATHAHLGALIVICELTGSYELLPPMMAVVALGLISPPEKSLYPNQVKNKFVSRAHLWDLNPAQLQHLTIAELCRGTYESAALVADALPLPELIRLKRTHHETDFLVVTELGQLVGGISFKDFEISEHDSQENLPGLVASDLISRRAFAIRSNDSVHLAVSYLLENDFNKVAVFSGEDPTKLLGYLRYKDILKAYSQMGHDSL